MFSHEVINLLLKKAKKYKSVEIYYSSLAKQIRESHKFHLENLSGFRESFLKMTDEKDLFYGDNGTDIVRCPYPLLWFDYVVDTEFEMGTEDRRSTKRGILVQELLPNFIEVATFFYDDASKVWIPPVIIHMFTIGKLLKERPDVIEYFDIVSKYKNNLLDAKTNMNCNYQNIVVSRHLLHMMQKDPVRASSIIDTMINENLFEVGVLNFALTILNCKNITTKVIVPFRKSGKKKKLPPKKKFEYHVLRLVLPKTTQKKHTQESSNRRGSKELVRVHFCRGHFKTYTEEAPLFGKYTGVYWWQPYIRGSIKQGYIEKEYSIESERTKNAKCR